MHGNLARDQVTSDAGAARERSSRGGEAPREGGF